MENITSSKTKTFSQFISYMVDFSLENSNSIAKLKVDTEFSNLLDDLESLFFSKIEGSSTENIKSFSLSLSELLTFFIFSHYIKYESSSFQELTYNIYFSDKNILFSLFNKYSFEFFHEFLASLRFNYFFSFLINNYDPNYVLAKEDRFKFIYETFLVKYNKKLKKKIGSYFSPDEAITFIIASLKQLITAKDFSKALQNRNIVFMDPACGTGSFLIKNYSMLSTLPDQYKLPNSNFHSLGFDINAVSYMLAKQNFSLLYDVGKDNVNNLPLPEIYNLNPLISLKRTDSNAGNPDEVFKQNNSFSNHRNTKDTVQIIFGNPPYSAVSNNSNNWINNLLKGFDIDTNATTHNYFEVDGESIKEKKSGWLYDDYIKFIRVGQYLIDQAEAGILSFVSNNAFLSNPSFRGMRCQLVSTFDKLFILDLHGNKLVDNPPPGITDENIFNIIQGNCIFIFVKNPSQNKVISRVYYYDLWGSKKDKLEFLQANTYESITWKSFIPQEPFYNFLPEDGELRKAYSKFWSLKDIFKEYGTGLITSKDSLALQFSKKEMIDVLQDFAGLDPEQAREKYSLGPDTENWKVSSAQKDLLQTGISEDLISEIVYRPFDRRYTYYTGNANGFHGRPKAISNHLFQKHNLAFVSARTNKTRNIDHFFISSTLTEAKCAESSTQSYVFPLRIFNDNIEFDNFNNDFIHAVEKKFNCEYSFNNKITGSITNEDILSYIYAITYSTNYRNNFKPFFMYDFPRIPLVDDYSAFKQLINYGRKLIDLHLLDFNIESENILEFCSANNRVITKVNHRGQKLFINKEDYFYPISESSYNFTIGNYKVLAKWLIGRKNTYLSDGQINEFEKIVYAINETFLLIEKINELY